MIFSKNNIIYYLDLVFGKKINVKEGKALGCFCLFQCVVLMKKLRLHQSSISQSKHYYSTWRKGERIKYKKSKCLFLVFVSFIWDYVYVIIVILDVRQKCSNVCFIFIVQRHCHRHYFEPSLSTVSAPSKASFLLPFYLSIVMRSREKSMLLLLLLLSFSQHICTYAHCIVFSVCVCAGQINISTSCAHSKTCF